MRDFKIDEANVMQPQVVQVNNDTVRLYFDQKEETREGMEGEQVTVFTSKFVELPATLGLDALTLAKTAVIAEIKKYDTSKAVNEFFYNGDSMWLDDATRTKLAKRLDVDKKSGLSTTRVNYEGRTFELPVESAEVMLFQLEQYARDSFDKTNEHLATVEALTTVEDVVAYDYTVGYPTKLTF